MSDPRRLIEDGANAFEAKLLRAGQRDAPSARNRRRVMAGLGLGSVLSTSVVASGAKAGTTHGWLSAGALRWVGGGAVSAIAVWTGVHALAPTPAKVAARPVAPLIVARPIEAAANERPDPAQPSTAAPSVGLPSAGGAAKSNSSRSVSSQRAAPATDSAQDSLSAELAALDQARRALVSRDSGQALRLLNEYAGRFPRPRLGSEATVLRIEALTARGDRGSAARLGREFLARNPNGPYARRVSSLIAEPSSSAKAD